MPPKKTVRSVLVDMLDDLDKMQLKKFCGAILDREGEPKVKRQMLYDKDCEDIANVLITTFTESGAIEVAPETLEIIRCNAQKERLVKDIASLNSVSSEVPPNFVSIRYGDIMKVETTGASKLTAQQDQLKYSGVTASNAMAETDLADMNNYKSNIIKAAQQKGVDPALVAALISRSSRAGRTLTDGKGCYNKTRGAYDTFGLLQLDVNPNGGGHKPKGTWDSEEHLCQALDILLYFIVRIKNKFPEWTKEQQLKGGIAAYHSGDGNIHSYEAVDAKTACGDYSNDVVARAQWYKSEGGF